MMQALKIKLFDFLKKIDGNKFDFKDKIVNLKPINNTDITNEIFIDSNITFENCTIIIDEFSEISTIIKNNLKSLKISILNCKIFVRFFDFDNIFNIIKYDFFNKCNNNEIVIYNATYNYNKDNLENLYYFTKEINKNSSKVICCIKCIFKSYPEDYDRFLEILKEIKIQTIHFDFLYTSQHKEGIPNITFFSSLLGELRIRNANLTRRELPFCEHMELINCKGTVFAVSRNITISNSRNFEIRCLPGAKLNIENGSYGSVSCKGQFSIYFDNPLEYTDEHINISEGTVKNTNKKSLLRERININKFNIFVNEDFSSDNKITKFFKCKFINCVFNSNQYLLDCEFSKCIFTEGKEFVINT